MANTVRIPPLVSLETALKLYYEKVELCNRDILELFGDLSTATVSRLKSKAREQMAADGVPSWSGFGVNTESAYRSWGIDINNIEARYNKLKELNLA